MLAALREGCAPTDLASAVVYAASLRIARFPTSNEFGDWDTAHHSFTFANAFINRCGESARRSWCVESSTLR